MSLSCKRLNVLMELMTPLPSVSNISAMRTASRIRGKIIRTVLCCIVYDSLEHCPHTYTDRSSF